MLVIRVITSLGSVLSQGVTHLALISSPLPHMFNVYLDVLIRDERDTSRSDLNL